MHREGVVGIHCRGQVVWGPVLETSCRGTSCRGRIDVVSKMCEREKRRKTEMRWRKKITSCKIIFPHFASIWLKSKNIFAAFRCQCWVAQWLEQRPKSEKNEVRRFVSFHGRDSGICLPVVITISSILPLVYLPILKYSERKRGILQDMMSLRLGWGFVVSTVGWDREVQGLSPFTTNLFQENQPF